MRSSRRHSTGSSRPGTAPSRMARRWHGASASVGLVRPRSRLTRKETSCPGRDLFVSSRRRHTRSLRDWSSDVCSSDLFLLQRGVRAPAGVRAWTKHYHSWLKEVQLSQPAAQLVFEDYREVEQLAQERVRRLEQELRTWAEQHPRLALIVAALQIFRGIGFLSAATIAVEVGDFRRFASATSFMHFLGITPSEHSSGESQHRGGITHAGNRYL